MQCTTNIPFQFDLGILAAKYFSRLCLACSRLYFVNIKAKRERASHKMVPRGYFSPHFQCQTFLISSMRKFPVSSSPETRVIERDQLFLPCTHLPSQSAPTILVLKTWVGLWSWKKRSEIWVAKSKVQKNRVIVIQKEKRPGCFFSFLITMTLFFATWFLQPLFWTFF